MLNPIVHSVQSELYRAEHKKFKFHASKCKVGSRADRVYSYYSYNNNWNKDKYLTGSQEANNKSLQSREGRKLNLHAYHKQMSLQLWRGNDLITATPTITFW